jgi:SAM-dependent methyltransferase
MKHDNSFWSEVYSDCYRAPWYRMGIPRKDRVLESIGHWRSHTSTPIPGGTILDVGCGRGEVLAEVASQFKEAVGVELVPALCGNFHSYTVVNGSLQELNLNQFDLVVCSDVLEHIEPDDTELALQNLWNHTRQMLVLHVAWFPHIWKLENGESIDLHINKRDVEEWSDLCHALEGHSSIKVMPNNDQTAMIEILRNRP